ncbi:hypothetical protein K1T35_01235 [Pseudonocardia sp. DSM 110487]|uniref:LppU/SCO3897 family protein n=1 Tax=Pseudonocardia sp. DSM 110487 TaxID=2865833 RepID=UPI001C6A13F6|nr:hypothetical protein [Pseudonocardia sp. DSM 110487]QYN36018.1 hypothetical protein K1T35_01235 [Pseudonocardia sp. DSM 110487]
MIAEGEIEMVLRVLLLLAVAVLAGGGLTACSSGPQTGDCVEKSGDVYVTADCGTASLRVLERFDSFSGDCIPVAGVSESFSDTATNSTLCIGPRDVDPAAAINVAKEGDCVTNATRTDVRRVDCADPTAEEVVLRRIEDATTIGGSDQCTSVPGTSTSYSWDMVTTGNQNGPSAADGLAADLLFCLGLVGVDPNASPDTAQVGDCMAETSEGVGYAKVDCGAPNATLRVVERVDNASMGFELACGSRPEVTAGLESGQGLDGYVLCMAPK